MVVVEELVVDVEDEVEVLFEVVVVATLPQPVSPWVENIAKQRQKMKTINIKILRIKGYSNIESLSFL